MWVESMSTENTRAPSLASMPAKGRPTVSELCTKRQSARGA